MSYNQHDDAGSMPLTENALAALGRDNKARKRMIEAYVGQRSKEYERRVEHTPDARKSKKSKKKSMEKRINNLDPRLP